MAMLLLGNESFDLRCVAANVSLRSWLNGSWAFLFSHPQDFSPHASTPKGYLTSLAHVMASSGIKLLELQSEGPTPSWVDESDPARAVLALNVSDSATVDLQAHALAKKIHSTLRPFVIVLDEQANCRATLHYRPENIVRPRTLEDIIETINVLRGDKTCAVEGEAATQRSPSTTNVRRSSQNSKKH